MTGQFQILRFFSTWQSISIRLLKLVIAASDLVCSQHAQSPDTARIALPRNLPVTEEEHGLVLFTLTLLSMNYQSLMQFSSFRPYIYTEVPINPTDSLATRDIGALDVIL